MFVNSVASVTEIKINCYCVHQTNVNKLGKYSKHVSIKFYITTANIKSVNVTFDIKKPKLHFK
jgi:hypothetical protein